MGWGGVHCIVILSDLCGCGSPGGCRLNRCTCHGECGDPECRARCAQNNGQCWNPKAKGHASAWRNKAPNDQQCLSCWKLIHPEDFWQASGTTGYPAPPATRPTDATPSIPPGLPAPTGPSPEGLLAVHGGRLHVLEQKLKTIEQQNRDLEQRNRDLEIKVDELGEWLKGLMQAARAEVPKQAEVVKY